MFLLKQDYLFVFLFVLSHPTHEVLGIYKPVWLSNHSELWIPLVLNDCVCLRHCPQSFLSIAISQLWCFLPLFCQGVSLVRLVFCSAVVDWVWFVSATFGEDELSMDSSHDVLLLLHTIHTQHLSFKILPYILLILLSVECRKIKWDWPKCDHHLILLQFSTYSTCFVHSGYHCLYPMKEEGGKHPGQVTSPSQDTLIHPNLKLTAQIVVF